MVWFVEKVREHDANPILRTANENDFRFEHTAITVSSRRFSTDIYAGFRF